MPNYRLFKGSGGIKSWHGFSLLEVLIAIVVLAFGLLGAAALQTKALQNSSMSFNRSVASLIANDIKERAWARLGVSSVSGDCKLVSSYSGTNGDLQAEAMSVWSGALPDLDIVIQSDECVFLANLSWVEQRVDDDSVSEVAGVNKSTFEYEFKLPNFDG